MKQISAVEWLILTLYPTISIRLSDTYIKEITDKAKEMEKQQILEFTRNAVRKILDEDRTNPFNLEQYYNETYGGNK
jgi:hypothetical protein